MNRNPIANTEAAEILKEYNGGTGLTVTQLGKKYSRQNCTIVRFLRRQGVFVKKASWDKSSCKLTPELVEKIGEAYKAGESQDALGLRFGMSATLIRKALARAGVESRESWQPATTVRYDSTHAHCSSCGERKTLDQFYNDSKTGTPLYICKECFRWEHRLREYGITREQYGALFTAQEGKCACCCLRWGGNAKHPDLVVDHDHATGKIRGLLCPDCNQMLGHAKDSQDTLQKALAYLQLHQSPPAGTL